MKSNLHITKDTQLRASFREAQESKEVEAHVYRWNFPEYFICADEAAHRYAFDSMTGKPYTHSPPPSPIRHHDTESNNEETISTTLLHRRAHEIQNYNSFKTIPNTPIFHPLLQQASAVSHNLFILYQDAKKTFYHQKRKDYFTTRHFLNLMKNIIKKITGNFKI